MTDEWSEQDLRQISRDAELRIAAYRADGTVRGSVLVWSVVHDGAVFVRSWYRKEKGWNAAAARVGRAQVHVGDAAVDVRVDDMAAADTTLWRAVDDAYRRKYGERAGGMVSDAAAGTTLRLLPDAPPRATG